MSYSQIKDSFHNVIDIRKIFDEEKVVTSDMEGLYRLNLRKDDIKKPVLHLDLEFWEDSKSATFGGIRIFLNIRLIGTICLLFLMEKEENSWLQKQTRCGTNMHLYIPSDTTWTSVNCPNQAPSRRNSLCTISI